MTKPNPLRNQSQASLTDQLNELIVLANKNGLYDAADWLRNRLEADAKARFMVSPRELEYARQGSKSSAVTSYRDRTKVSLAVAKKTIEAAMASEDAAKECL